jgi:hypothetical protein
MVLEVALERGRMSVLVGVGVETLGSFAQEARLALPSKPFAGGKHHFIGARHAHANLTHWRGFKGVHLLDTLSLHRRPAKPTPRPGHVGVRGWVINEVWMADRRRRDGLGHVTDRWLIFKDVSVEVIHVVFRDSTGDVIE